MPANCFRRVATSSLAGWTTRISRTPCPLLNAGGETRAQTVLAALRNCARAPPPVFRSYVIAITQDEELRRKVLHRNPCNPGAPVTPAREQNRPNTKSQLATRRSNPPSTRKAAGGGPARSSAAKRGLSEHGAPGRGRYLAGRTGPRPRPQPRRSNYADYALRMRSASQLVHASRPSPVVAERGKIGACGFSWFTLSLKAS